MSDMIERVARAIAVQNRAADWDKIDEYDVSDRGYLLRSDYLGLARAAIEAMREPPDAMINECRGFEFCPDDPSELTRAWQAMIDAALK